MGLPTIIAGIGLGLNVVGSLASASAQAKSLRDAAQINAANAEQAEAEGIETVRRSAFEEYNLRGEGAKVLAAQQTVYGASGVVGGTGSAAAVEFGTRLALETDAAALRFNAQNELYAKRIEAWNYRRQSAASAKAAGAAVVGGVLNAGSTLLTGLGSMGVKWGKPTVNTGSTYTGRMLTPTAY